MTSRRFYRQLMENERMVSFTVKVKETDLWIAVDALHFSENLSSLVEKHIWGKRQELEKFINYCPEFQTTIEPFIVENPHELPDIALQMMRAGNKVNVGPMAAVAGIFAELAGEYLLEDAREVIVENGGDIFLQVENTCRVGVYAGNSPLSGKVALEIMPESTPLGICTSSATVGPSYSSGEADAVVVLSPSTPLADAVATSVGNMIDGQKNLEEILQTALQIEGIEGLLIIQGEKMAAQGNIKLVKAESS